MSNEEEDVLDVPLILLKREGDSWRAELPGLLPDWQSVAGDIRSVVAAARKAAGNPTDTGIKLKVAERTELDRDDVLGLIEANPWPEHIFGFVTFKEINGGPQDLDLRRTTLLSYPTSDKFWKKPIDLSRDTIQRERDTYRQRNDADPPLFSRVTQGAFLTGARLQGADLWKAQLQGADLRDAHLEGAYLGRAHLQRAVLVRARLERAGLSEAQLQGADLREAHLEGAVLGNAHLQRAVLNRARLEGAHLWKAQLQGANLQGAQLQGAGLQGGQLQGASLTGAQLQGADLRGAQLQKAGLAGAQLRGAHLSGANLQEVDLRRFQLQGARELQLQEPDLGEAGLQGAFLVGAQLQGVDLYDAVSLERVHWYGAFIDHTRMRREQLGNAIGDEIQAHKVKTVEACRIASEAYLLLKNNFNSIGRHDDEKWALSKQQSMEQAALWREGRRISALVFFARRHRNVAIGAFTFSATLLGVIVTLLTLLS